VLGETRGWVELPEEEGQLSEEDYADATEGIVDYLRATAAKHGQPVRARRTADRTLEQEEALQAEARGYLAQDGVDASQVAVEVVELEDVSMKDAPEVKYDTDKKHMLRTYDQGDIHVMEASCAALLARKPDDSEVWRALTISRLRLNLWDAALESARQWIEHDPFALAPRNAEALALAGLGCYGEARARLEQLAIEVEAQDAAMAAELREGVWRIDELWREPEPGVCSLSARLGPVLLGLRPPHFYLPNFADSVGPVALLQAEPEELGGGQSHRRKIVTTADVAKGGLLLVQSPLVFGLLEEDGHVERLADGLATAATTSSRSAALLELLADDGPLAPGDDALAVATDARRQRPGGAWSREPAEMPRRLEACRRVVERSRLDTGRAYAGVWPLPGLARHSCWPSANATFFGDTLVARAARDLRAGDEVTFSFLDALEPLEVRREAAMERCGGFWCRCPRCEAEEALPPAAAEAAERLRLVFQLNSSRTTAVKERLMVQMEAKKHDFQRRFDYFRNAGARRYHDGLVGLADRFRELNGRRIEDDDLEEVRELLPEPIEPHLVDVPPDLAEELLEALRAFEEDLDSLGLEGQQRHWFVASHLTYYNEANVLVALQKDAPAQRWLVQRMLAALAATAPGSFLHQRMSIYNWQLAAQSEDPGLEHYVPSQDPAPREKEIAHECMKLRYGDDINLMEMDAAMARTAVSQCRDENFCWEVSWCIGATAREQNPDITQGSLP